MTRADWIAAGVEAITPIPLLPAVVVPIVDSYLLSRKLREAGAS